MLKPLTERSLKRHSKTLASGCSHLAIVYEKYGVQQRMPSAAAQ